MEETISENELIKGIFILSTNIEQPFVYSKSLTDFASITKIAELINSFNVKFLIKSLSSKGYHGSEVMDFPEFGVAFLKLSDTDVLAILTATEVIQPEAIIQQVRDEVREIFFNKEFEKRITSLPAPNTEKSRSKKPPLPDVGEQ